MRVNKLALAGALASTVGIANSAMAFEIDTTAVTTALSDAGVAIAAVGAAYLTMRVGAKVWKWIQAAF